MQRWLRILAGLAILALAGWGAARHWQTRKPPAVTYETVPVKRGNLVATIAATGTVEPEEVVDVGAQIAGQINSFGKDDTGAAIDYGSQVEAGTVLALIDDAIYRADAAQAAAQLQQAKAGVANAEANLVQLKAKLEQARRDWERAQKVGPSDALSQSSFDAFRAGFDAATANVTAGEAAILQARATVAEAEAAVLRAQTNLGYCVIKSPVKGVIVDRRVNIGQTVVSSLNAPSLFLIAKDLKRMQVWIAVNEADIGNIHPGQPVTFTVDAYPGQTFQGEVAHVRLNATMTQNVVTYTVEVNTDNSSGRLLPYLTANAQFEISRREHVLLVPNAALRWLPQPQAVAPAARQGAGSGERHRAGAAATEAGGAAEGGPTAETVLTHGTVWVPDGAYVRPLPVKVGLSDGVMTEIQGPAVTEGMEVIVSEAGPDSARGGAAGGGSTTNPFTPQLFRGARH